MYSLVLCFTIISFLVTKPVISFTNDRAMAYSIAILDQCDFEGISRQMPSGTGVDASLADGTTASKKRKKRGKYKK